MCLLRGGERTRGSNLGADFPYRKGCMSSRDTAGPIQCLVAVGRHLFKQE
jgi:hypothetical protein